MKRQNRAQLARRVERLESTIGRAAGWCVCGLPPEFVARGFRAVGFAEETPDGMLLADPSLDAALALGWGRTVTVECDDCGLERLAIPFRAG